jgi:ABC-2 type transport system ATP-binding protein
VSKSFGDNLALDSIDLEIATGEVVALLGPNGAGKSTLLRIIGTTIIADEGHVHVGGRDVRTDPTGVRRTIGVALGDERSWYWRLTGRRNLEFFAVLCGFARPAARRRAAELLDEVGLAEAADRRFDGYSSGMKARLSLARALLTEPPVLLLDEPTRTLDPLAAADFRALALSLARDRGRTLLFATHDLHEAAAVASRVVVLARGKVAMEVGDALDAAGLERAVQQAAGAA